MFFLSLLLAVLSFDAVATARLIPNKVKQGQPVLVVLPDRAEKGEATFIVADDQKAPVWRCRRPTGNARCAIVGVPIDKKPGKWNLFESREPDQKPSPVGSVLVRKARFKVNRLTVDPSLTSPTDEQKERIAREKERIEKAYAAAHPSALWTDPFDYPTAAKVTSRFGNHRTYNGEVKSVHFGVDLQAGSTTKIHAANAGRVVLADEFFLAGNMVLVDHGSGVFSSYSHLSTLAVRPGQEVARGEFLGFAGSTGRATGPHLHWGVRVNGIAVDPIPFLSTINRGIFVPEEKVEKKKKA